MRQGLGDTLYGKAELVGLGPTSLSWSKIMLTIALRVPKG